MPGARYVGFWFAIVGTALMLQGCWEEEDRFTLLGSGGCRTEDGRHGDQTTLAKVTFDECQAKCFNGNGPCTAIEYTSTGGACEIHSEPITKFEEAEGVACYITK